MLGHWPKFEANSEVEESRRSKRRGKSTKRRVIFDDIDDNDVEVKALKTRKATTHAIRRKKAAKNDVTSHAIRRKKAAKNDVTSERNFEILDAQEEDENESFFQNFKDDIKVK